MKKRLLCLACLVSTVFAGDYYYEYGKKVDVVKLKESRTIGSNSVDFYKTQNGHKVGITNEIIVQCEENINCVSLLERYSFSSISKISDNFFVVKINKNQNIFEVSQMLYNDAEVKLAQPNLIKNRKSR